MKVRAKFRCNTVTKHDGGAETVKMMPVYSEAGVNKEWSEYTPSGSLEMLITTKGAVGVFEVGTEYLLEITPANDEE